MTSLLLSIKGAIFLAKSGSSKLHPYLRANRGLAAIGDVNTAVGCFTAPATIPEDAQNGFKMIIDGVSKGNFYDFMNGLHQLEEVYSKTDELMEDLYLLIDHGNCDSFVKNNLKKSFQDLKPLIVNEIDHKSYELLKECEDYLKRCGMTSEGYISEIKRIYYRNTYNVDDNYRELLGQGGKIYDEISSFNRGFHISSINEYDHYLAYCIAGWMLDNLQLSCLKNVSQKKLAGDITDNIFTYLRYMKNK